MTFSRDLGKLVFPIVVVAGLAVFGYFFFKTPQPGFFAKLVAFLVAAFFIVFAAVVPPLAEFVSGRRSHPF